MCYFCKGERHDYKGYVAAINSLQAGVTDKTSFLANSGLADKLRFQDSPEWSEPPIVSQVEASIFRNPDPEEGLLLFVLTAWLDLQARYTCVWNQMLPQTQGWLNTTAWTDPGAETPRDGFPLTRPHLLKTIATLANPAYSRSIARWFTSAVTEIVEDNGTRKGNLYRFVSRVYADLYEAKYLAFLRAMASGRLPDDYQGTHYKRLWMLMMFLTRDEGVIRCLLRRALSKVPGGEEALEYWADNRYFDSAECELPVDVRVNEAWKKLPFAGGSPLSVEAVARQARELARSASSSPSAFDALLFFK